jgi:DNA-binding NarL/FixJ family response regulator
MLHPELPLHPADDDYATHSTQVNTPMTKVILADVQAIFRTGAAKVLAVEDDLRIVAQCEDITRLATAITSFHQSVVILASAFRPDFPQFLTQLKDCSSRGIIIGEDAEGPKRYLELGFDGFIHRNISGHNLVSCVRHVARGDKWAASSDRSHDADELDAVGTRVRDRLTPKEMKIVGLIVQGYKNKEIAQVLGTTEQVIKNYLRSVYDKTGVSDRLELALFTIHHRVLAEAAAQAGTVQLPSAS